MASTITFNSYDLQTTSIITEKILHTSSPDCDLPTEQIARRDGSVIMSDYWIKKTIISNGHIIGSSVADLDSKIDALKQNLVGTNLNLDIGYAGGTRRYLATVRKIDIEREHYNNYWTPFTIEFVCADPFGRATSSTNHSLDAQVASPFSLAFSMVGSIPAYPVITLTCDAINSVSVIKIENTVTTDFLTVTRTFTAGDILEVDCNNQTVKANTVEVDYSGIFPSFIVGSNTVKITVTGTSFSIDLDVDYTKLYL
jgi:hypothetical protein